MSWFSRQLIIQAIDFATLFDGNGGDRFANTPIIPLHWMEMYEWEIKTMYHNKARIKKIKQAKKKKKKKQLIA